MQMRNTRVVDSISEAKELRIKFDRIDTSWSFNARCAKRVVLIPITDSAQKQRFSRADNRSGIYTLRACDTSRCVRLSMGYKIFFYFSFSIFSQMSKSFRTF